MRVKPPFTIEYHNSKNRSIQFLRNATGEFLGQFNTCKGKRTGTFTTFLPRPIKYLGRFVFEPLTGELTWFGGMRILNKVFYHLYHNEPVSEAQTKALMTVSSLMLEMKANDPRSI